MTGAFSIDDGIEIRLAGRTTAAALEQRALLDRKRHVVDVAVDLRGGLQGDRLSANDAGDLAADDHLLAGDHAGHLAPFADDDLGALHITLDLAVDLQDTLADDLQALADDLEIVADHGLFETSDGAWPVLSAVGSTGTGSARRGRWRLGRRATRKHENPPMRSD